MAKKTTRKKSSAKKTTAKKTTSKKTTAAAKTAATVGVDEKLVKKVLAARKRGESWSDIRENLGITRGQINPIRKKMRELDPESVQESGPRGEGRQKKRSGSSKKKAAEGEKKSASKKTARRKKKGGRSKKGERLDLSSLSDSALLDALVGRTIVFKINADAKKPTTKVVKEAKMLKPNDVYGRIVQVKTTDARTHSLAVDWIKTVS